MTTRPTARRGLAYVFALILLALCTSLSVAMVAGVNLNLKRSENLKQAQVAQLAAESGLQLMALCMQDMSMPASTDGQTFITNLSDALGNILNGTGNLGGLSVSAADSVVSVPPIIVEGMTFSCKLTRMEPDA
ncbi:MAG: hypothetical protein QF577_03085 [Phycisphaerae bacterium]|nr:hypothetical protein [Phycisphaerae bacterium]MDP7636516.1 hypothetical protein [Phycisphaerae bacterium]